MRNGCLTFVLLIFSFFQPVLPQSVNLPLDHWAYNFLERMETKGIVTHLRDGSRPFTRKKVAGFVRKIDTYAKQNPGILSRVDNQMLERLKGEMWDELHYGMMTIQESEREPHIYSWKSNQGFLHVDGVGSAGLLLRDKEAESTERQIYSAYFGGILRGRLWRIGVYSDNRIHTE